MSFCFPECLLCGFFALPGLKAADHHGPSDLNSHLTLCDWDIFLHFN